MDLAEGSGYVLGIVWARDDVIAGEPFNQYRRLALDGLQQESLITAKGLRHLALMPKQMLAQVEKKRQFLVAVFFKQGQHQAMSAGIDKIVGIFDPGADALVRAIFTQRITREQILDIELE
jgi:hypothetical protein